MLDLNEERLHESWKDEDGSRTIRRLQVENVQSSNRQGLSWFCVCLQIVELKVKRIDWLSSLWNQKRVDTPTLF